MSKQVMSRLDEFDPSWIVFQIPTLQGTLKEVHLSREYFSEEVFERGYSVEIKGKLYAIPRPESYAEVPWYPRTVRFLSYLREESGVRYPLDLYYPLEKISKKLQVMIKSSISFRVVEGFSADRSTKERGPSVGFESKEGRWNPLAMNLPEKEMESYPYDAYYGVRQQVADLTRMFGYNVEKHFHGKGTSQQVISLDAMQPVKGAEALISLRYISRAISPANNVNITFMPYLIPAEPGNNLTIEILGLFENGELTQEGRYFIGGILHHYKTLLLFTNPTPNSYKRFFHEQFYRAWSVNIPATMVTLSGERIILSFPDAIANPFLAYAAVLAAGLDGINSSIDPGDPINTHPKVLPTAEKKRKKVQEFPKDILPVIEALESDSEYLKGIFSTELLIEYVEHIYREIRENLSYPTAYELDRYFYR